MSVVTQYFLDSSWLTWSWPGQILVPTFAAIPRIWSRDGFTAWVVIAL